MLSRRGETPKHVNGGQASCQASDLQRRILGEDGVPDNTASSWRATWLAPRRRGFRTLTLVNFPERRLPRGMSSQIRPGEIRASDDPASAADDARLVFIGRAR